MIKISRFSFLSSIISFSILIIYNSLLPSKIHAFNESLKNNDISYTQLAQGVTPEMLELILKHNPYKLTPEMIDKIYNDPPKKSPLSGFIESLEEYHKDYSCTCYYTQNYEALKQGFRYVCVNEDGFRSYRKFDSCD